MIEYITKILRLSEIIYDLKINKLLIQVYLEIIEDYFLKLAEMIHSLVNEIECWMNHRESVRSFFISTETSSGKVVSLPPTSLGNFL